MKNITTFRRPLVLTAFAASAALALAACGGDAEDTTAEDTTAADTTASAEATTEGEIFSVEDPWIRATEETMETEHDHSMTGAFAHLTNLTDEDVVIVSAEVEGDLAGLVELHEVVEEGGQNVMREKEGGFPVAAGETYELNPGEDHIMLMELNGAIEPGDVIEITVNLESGESQTIEFTAKEYVGAQENYADMEHHNHGDHEGHDHDHEGHDH